MNEVLQRNFTGQFALTAMLCFLAGTSVARSPIDQESTPAEMVGNDHPYNWKPPWRKRNDCGPLALFVLNKLVGPEVDVDQIFQLTPMDPVRGASIESLLNTAEQIGFDLDCRYVKPDDLASLSMPFICHGKIGMRPQDGHFYVVVGYDAKRDTYQVIDPTNETMDNFTSDWVHKTASGYVLLPADSSNQWIQWSTIGFICGIGFLSWKLASRAVTPARTKSQPAVG